MTNAEPLFVDTNILIYANVATAPLHEAALESLQDAYRAKRPLWISRQVLREFIAARTRPQTFARPSTPDVVIERVRYLETRFQIADDILDVTGNSAVTGKSTHADRALDKPTFPSILGLDESIRQAEFLRDEAVKHLQVIPGDTSTLAWLADYVIRRDR